MTGIQFATIMSGIASILCFTLANTIRLRRLSKRLGIDP